MRKPTHRDLLRRFPGIDALDSTHQERLMEFSSHLEFEEGQCIFSQGDPAMELFLVLSGTIQVNVQIQPGDTVPLGRVGEHEILGEMGLLDDAPRLATAVATSRVHALAISKDRYARLARRGDPLALWLLDVTATGLARRIRATTNRIAQARNNPALLLQLPKDPGERARHWWQFLNFNRP